MKFYPKNTLAHYNAAPQTKCLNLGEIESRVFGAATKEYKAGCGQVSPDSQALEFYGLNHCASLVRKEFTPNEPLPDWALKVMETYTQQLALIGNRILHYMACIIVREARHLRPMPEEWWQGLSAKFGTDFMEFMKQVVSYEENGAVKHYCDNKLALGFGKFCEGIAYAFRYGKWQSNFGGKKWAVVAECLSSFVNGKTSMEMMVDTSFTLAHNTGPIFNKGMMYHSQSGYFIHILDVQRSGQVPELLMDSVEYIDISGTQMVKSICELTKHHIPNGFGPFLDWVKVEELGSVQKYESYKTKQKKAHGEFVPAFGLKGGHKTKPLGEMEVFPGQTVKVYERVKV